MALLVPPPLKRAAIGNKRKFQGIAFLLIILLMFYFVILLYNKKLIKTIPVSLRTDRIGNQLSLAADVKFRGVNVGDVRKIVTNGEVATLKLAMKPSEIGLIPSNVQARILPKTLFGQKYVELVSPDNAQQVPPLHKGDVIPQDRSRTAIEVEQLYDNLLPFLQTVQPEKLNATLTAIATALEGRGDKLGDNLVRLDDYLRQINQHLPSIQEDITGLANVSDIYADAAPDLLRFLDNTVVTSRTIVEKQDTLFALLTGTTDAANTASAVLQENRNRLIQAPQLGEDITRTVARRANNLPLIINGLTGLVPRTHAVFGTGPNRNWLHINLRFLGNKGPYKFGDCPKNLSPDGNQYGPNCPGRGGGNASGASTGNATQLPTASSPPSSSAMESVDAADAIIPGTSMTAQDFADVSNPSIGPVGSPEEKALLQQIVGAVNVQQTQTHDSSSDVTDLLLGPIMRGTSVTFQ